MATEFNSENQKEKLVPHIMEIDIHLLLDESGEHVVATDSDRLVSIYEEDIGERPSVTSQHYILKLTVPCPEPMEIRGNLSSGGADYRLEIKKC